MKYNNGLFIFFRDFRLYDNIGLINAMKSCENVYCCFIFTPEQVGRNNNYRSENAIQFMVESLEDLSQSISKKNGELMTFYGYSKIVVSHLIEKLKIDCVIFNDDYTPFAVQRKKDLQGVCNSNKISCETYSDYYLYEPGTVLSIQRQSYKKFTPFYENVIHRKVEKPLTNVSLNHFSISSVSLKYRFSLKQASQKLYKENPNILVHGGRDNALIRFNKSLKDQTKYDKMRDYLTYNTTFLSAYIKFGCLSIREIYHSFVKNYGKKSGLIRELLWREFFAHVLFQYPEVVGKSYQKKYRKIKWKNSMIQFEKWKQGKTGFPIVDAGMHQLNQTGYMHNRVRMVVASFLVKVLLIDWRLGEQYFAERLTDYDIASNNGNWQSISSTGVDMKPYFRDMNPWIQSHEFDSNTEYIKKWVPELSEVLPIDIHKWDEACHYEKYKNIAYSKPICDYSEQKEKMLQLYKDAL